jgi:hypothetical protein
MRRKVPDLGSRQRLDSRHVVDMDVERAGDGCDGDVVEIQAGRGQKSGVQRYVAVTARDAPEEQWGLARAVGAIAQARQELGVIIEVAYLKLLELLAAQHLEADGHFLQVFGALRGGYHDLFERPGLGCIKRIGRVGQSAAGQHRWGQRHAHPFGARARQFPLSATSH